MTWEVRLHSAFEGEVLALERDVRVALFAATKLLADFGPQLGRPHADTLKGSRHANMKELRFEAADGEWPSLSTLKETRSCSWPATRRAEARSASTRALSQKRIFGFPNIWKA
jgi:hypothetical protein